MAENRTDQDDSRKVGERVAPATTPSKDTIREDRAALGDDHGADDAPTAEEEAAAGRAGAVDPDVAEAYKDAIERGAAQEGEGKPGV
ncbi:MAG: hypothetical protein ACR2LQ_09405 [Acidimicrobiales bacterium]